ncbi:MAG: hypothetical protein ACQER7_14735 [Bacteroidota bacterium]
MKKIKYTSTVATILMNIVWYIFFTVVIGWFPVCRVVSAAYSSHGLMGVVAGLMPVMLIEAIVWFIFDLVIESD